jgi:hypothetical protein
LHKNVPDDDINSDSDWVLYSKKASTGLFSSIFRDHNSEDEPGVRLFIILCKACVILVAID